MATKAKASEMGEEAIGQAFKNGAEAVKENFEKAARSFGDMATYNRQAMEALVKSANVATKGIEQINTELMTYSRQAMEDHAAALKTVMTSKSLQDALEVQSDYSKAAFDSYLGQMTKVSEIVVGLAREISAPLTEQAKQFADLVHASRPAA